MPPCDILTVASEETETLLRAVARLPDLDWTVTIVGVVDMAAFLGIAARVRTTNDLDRCFEHAGCFVHATGPHEPAETLVAALRHGLPVALITDAGAPELLPPETCIVVVRGAADDLSKALRRIVFDTALRARMGYAAAAFAATLAPAPSTGDD